MPGLICLGDFGNLYEPVMFDHTIHAQMGNMGKGCQECHHNNTPNHILPCRDCHTKPQSLGQPGLKGAYHRQCMDCHTEWSHSTACVNCHAPTEQKNLLPDVPLQTTGHSRSVPLTKPATMLYETPYSQGNLVTFYHNDHADQFGLACIDCHRRESCVNCHDTDPYSVTRKTQKEIHGLCNECHQQDNCQQCHDKTKKQPFSHNTAKWRLGEYHNKLACGDCHSTGQRITSFVGSCVDCHEFSESDSFSHRVTGLELDEVHSEFSCEDCHANQQYHTNQDCSGCHDDDITVTKNSPGKKIQISALLRTGPINKDVH